MVFAARDRARAGLGGLLFLLGPAGMGKSAVIRHTVGGSAGTVVGRSSPPPAPTMQPLAGLALAMLRRGADPRRRALEVHRGALRVLLPASGLAHGETEQPTPMHVADALLELWGQLDERRPDTLVVEDSHWGDAFTLQALDYLADRLQGSNVLVVATARPTDVITSLVDRIARRHAAEIIELGPLDGDAAMTMAETCLGGPPSPEVADALAVAGGVPLAIEELLIGLERSDVYDVRSSVFGGTATRLDSLSASQRAVVDAAALLGRAFDPGTVASALDVQGERVDDGLRAGLRAGLLTPQPGSLRLWFAHDLIREAVVASIGASRTTELAGGLCQVLAVSDRLEDLERAAQLASAIGDGAGAAEILARIGAWYLDRAMPGEAVLRFDQALQQITRTVDALPVREQLVQALALCGDVARARTEVERVIRQLTAVRADRARVDACTVAAARGAANAGAWDEAALLLGELLAGPRPPPPAAAIGALVALERGDFPRAETLADLVASDETAAAADRCQAFEVLGRLARRSELERAERCFRQAVAVAELADLDLWAARAAHELATIAQLRTLDVDDIYAARGRALRAGAPGLVAATDFHLAAIHGVRFEPEPALVAARRCLDVARRLGATRQEAWAWGLIGQAHAAAGERDRASSAGAEALALAPDDPEIAAIAIGTARGLASLLADDRDRGIDEYRQAIDHLRGLPSKVPLPPWYLWPLLSSVYDAEGDGGARARREGGDAALRVVTAVDGLWHLADAVARGRTGDVAGANAAAASAQERFDAVPAFAGYMHLARRFAAEAALRDGWGEPAAWLVAAGSWAADLGHEGLRAVCATLGRKAGVPQRRRRRGAAEVPAHLAALGVTSREIDVLRLVAEGLTNAEIGERLYLSPRTVKGYVENLLAKTGAANRTQLVASAERIRSLER